MFTDFSKMTDHSLREKIAGEKTGPEGVNAVNVFGYINYLKEADACIQWSLFMPDSVKRQQNGFVIDTFDYVKLDSFSFIGFEAQENEDFSSVKEKMKILDELESYKMEYSFDLFFMHHFGKNVDKERMHGYWGRFYSTNCPVPKDFVRIAFTSEDNHQLGEPFLSQFAFATFSGDPEAMHRREGFDCNGLYDVTRNVILSQGVAIPYPAKYWNAEVFLHGIDKPSTAYLFSVNLKNKE